MGLFIILAILLVAFIATFIYGVIDDNGGIFALVPIIVITFTLVFLLLAHCDNLNYREFVANYYATRTMIENCQNDEQYKKEHSKDFVYALHRATLINSQIKKNQKHCHSFWIGAFYSEEIAATPLIPFDLDSLIVEYNFEEGHDYC